MKTFINFKSAHKFYKYPSTHRIGTIFDENGVIIARDLRGIALYNKVEELLNSI